jgi:hypothetical protein
MQAVGAVHSDRAARRISAQPRQRLLFLAPAPDLLARRDRAIGGPAQYFFSTTDSAVTRSMVCDSGRRESTAP